MSSLSSGDGALPDKEAADMRIRSNKKVKTRVVETEVVTDGGTTSDCREERTSSACRKVSFKEVVMGDFVTPDVALTETSLLDDISDDELDSGDEDDNESALIKVSLAEKRRLRS
ncbi:hypothetical protein DITRI_Ditri16bG0105300 [Diplodiscus trichospermus]